MRTVRRQPSSQLQKLYDLQEHLQRNFFPTLRRKIVTSEPQPRIESANIQTRYVQPGKSYALVTRTEGKQSNTNQKNQEKTTKTQEKIL